MAVKSMYRKVIGIEWSGAPSMPRPVKEEASARCWRTSRRFSVASWCASRREQPLVVQRSVDEIVLVHDSKIFDSVVSPMERCKLVTEGAAAATIAALRTGKVNIPKGTKAVCVLSGDKLKVNQIKCLN
ncbi:hypothetical protein [Ramlibacter sp.]|uniref:hypothetical protein n=1 Tax=Ramlibacter sp. TaxID=1917967 RepID=UPI00260BFCAE|nr:hypothetical protein [Ramlibacter sp.]MDB5953835.1 threonine dehydratase, medium form [Ramlibacter sp.]